MCSSSSYETGNCLKACIFYSYCLINVKNNKTCNIFIFFKRSFRFENDEEKSKTKVSIKLIVSLTIVDDNPSLMMVNDEPLLTIVNDNLLLKKRGNRPEGHLLSLSSF